MTELFPLCMWGLDLQPGGIERQNHKGTNMAKLAFGSKRDKETFFFAALHTLSKSLFLCPGCLELCRLKQCGPTKHTSTIRQNTKQTNNRDTKQENKSMCHRLKEAKQPEPRTQKQTKRQRYEKRRNTQTETDRLSFISMFQNRVMLQCSLWLFRSWGKSFPIRPETAPKRGSGLAFRRPESARKVHAKSFGA